MNAYSLSRLFIAWLTCLATLLFAPLLPAVEAEKAPPAAAEDNTLSIHIDDMLRPWRGDLPGMIDRRTIRVLTTYSKTFFFIPRFYVSTSKSIIKALINMHSFEIQLSPIG
ncbi:hypothetical protein AN2341V1_4703 [Klebsiella pneumoniae]|nr:hypothetical protein AI2754V5_4765 [Klebsiella pneumoniae]CAE7606193.1 hypothetical protein AI2757V1_4717 [Klebsiella pneumoniae]CAE7641259.1 hypothetical protein AI2761V1_4712 [Klebsiella pneumoniae]CAF2225430.1 hypothetical protein AI2741V1_4719 [Klebsiella pneumoniae]CAF2243067.1 hypothetical protein AI2751V1_4718 [Klebsiella pneumoniae]